MHEMVAMQTFCRALFYPALRSGHVTHRTTPHAEAEPAEQGGRIRSPGSASPQCMDRCLLPQRQWLQQPCGEQRRKLPRSWPRPCAGRLPRRLLPPQSCTPLPERQYVPPRLLGTPWGHWCAPQVKPHQGQWSELPEWASCLQCTQPSAFCSCCHLSTDTRPMITASLIWPAASVGKICMAVHDRPQGLT